MLKSFCWITHVKILEYVHMNLDLFQSENVVLCCLLLLGIKELLPVCCVPSLLPPASLGFLHSSIFNLDELYYLVESSSLPFFPSLLYTPCLLFCKSVDELRDCGILLFSWNAKGMFCLSVFVAILDWWLWRFIYLIVLPNNSNAVYSVPEDAGQRVVFKSRSKE